MTLRTRLTFRQLLLFCSSICLVLTLLFGVSFSCKFIDQYRKERILSAVERNLDELSSLSKKQREAESLAQTENAHYLETHLTSLPFLNYERGALKLLRKQRSLNQEEARRWHFITKENYLKFRSNKKIENGSFHEIEEKLIHTVQIDENDLQVLLEKIEGNTHSRPPLRIKRLSLEKIHDAPRYTLNLELWRKDI